MILQRKHVENFYFQKQYCELLALNNIHVGAKLNRDQTIIKTIQETIEIASEKNRKNNKTRHCSCGPEAKPARGLLGHLFLGPRPDSQRPGRRIGPPRRPLPLPAWAVCQPRRRDAISAADFDRTVVRAFRRIKTRRLRGVRKP